MSSSRHNLETNVLDDDSELIYEYVDENRNAFDDNTSSAFASKFGTFDKSHWQTNISHSPIRR